MESKKIRSLRNRIKYAESVVRQAQENLDSLRRELEEAEEELQKFE